MKVVLLIAAWVISALAYNKKAFSRDCGNVLSSVRMEVSPTLLHLICSNNNHTTLVVDCGSNIWYEKLTGFCNSFDLNIGQVLMNQPLLSSTITLQLVKSGQILDAARVAILTSEHLLHYRISVWGNRNTRFLLAIEKGCAPSQHNDMSGTLGRDEQSSVRKSSRHLPLLHVNSELPMSGYGKDPGLSRTDQSYVTGDETRRVPEYLGANKLANVEHNNYAFLKLQQLLPGSREASRFGTKPTQIEIYRSKVAKPEPRVGADHLQQYDEDYSEDDFMTTTPESSELAKLRWMEEKRILFEQRMKFLRNFYPESEDTIENENPSVDDPDEKEKMNKLPTRFDYHRDGNEPSSSADSGRRAEDAQNSRYTETPSGDYDYQQIRRSKRLQLSRKDSHNEEHTKLEYRQLSNSDASLNRNNDGKSWFIQTLHPSVKSVFTNTLSTTQPQDALFKKRHKNFTSAEISNSEFGVRNATQVNNISLQTVQQSITGNKLQSVFKEPLHNNWVSTNTIERLSEKDKGIVQSFQSSTTSINVTDKIFTTKFSRSNSYSQGTTETTLSDRLSQNVINSHDLQVDKDGVVSSKPTTAIDNLIPVLSIAVGRVLHNVTSKLQNVTSKLQNELQRNLRSPSDDAVTEDSVRDTTTVPNFKSSTSTQAQTEGSTYLSSSVSDKLNNDIQLVSTNMVKENNALFTSPVMNSLYSSTEKLEKVKYSISSMYVISTIPAKIHSSALDGRNDRSPVTLPTSQSFPHSVPLEMKTSSQGPSIKNKFPYIVDETASPATTEQPSPAGKYVIAETVTSAVTGAPQLNVNNTDLLQKAKAKAVQRKDTIQSFLVSSNDTTQASATSLHSTTKVPSVIIKAENRVSPIVLENRPTEAIVQLDMTVTEHTATSAEQGTTSTLPSTSTSQGGENEPQEMGDDSFWPVVAALVIGIPVIVVLVIAITVIHKKRRLDPGNLFHRAALKISRNSSVITLRRKPMGARHQDNVINLRLDTVSTFSQDTSHPPSIDV